MLFNSYPFILLFLPVTLAVFLLLRSRGKIAWTFNWLVLASLFFYGWGKWSNLYLIGGSLVFNYLVGTQLGRMEAGQRKTRWFMGLGIAANLAFLGYYKYADFFVGNVNAVFGIHWPALHVVLPVGISFYTFQAITYVVDSANGSTRGYNFRDFCLFITFFPQLIVGPIVHHAEMMPQFRKEQQQRVDWSDFSVGVTLLVIGLSKKVLIADQFARWASPVFDAAQAGGTPGFAAAWVGAVAYAIQVYFDFSGYSDMAIGLGRLFGIKIPLNFNSPYKAQNISDFWRRWHMTLSRLLRDYLYIPLGGNRSGQMRSSINLMTTMLISGLWHGAGWTYVFMGGLQGIYLSIYQRWSKARKREGRAAPPPTARAVWTGRLVTFFAVVVSYVFFRAASLGAAFTLQKSMFGLNGFSFTSTDIPLGTAFWACSAMMLVVWFFPNSHEMLARYQPALEYVDGKVSHAPTPQWLNRRLQWQPNAAWALWLAGLMAASIVCLSRPSEFIYWQF